jgi:hypothetical protein
MPILSKLLVPATVFRIECGDWEGLEIDWEAADDRAVDGTHNQLLLIIETILSTDCTSAAIGEGRICCQVSLHCQQAVTPASTSRQYE